MPMDGDADMGNVIGDLRHEDFRFDARHGHGCLADVLRTLVELAALACVIPLEVQLDGDQHAEHLLFVDLQTAADGIRVGRTVEARGLDERLASQQQAGALRARDPLPAREGDEIEAHLRVLPEILDGRHVGGGVVEGGDTVLLAKLRELLVSDLPDVVVRVVEEHHRGLRVDGPLELLARLHFHDGDAAVPHRVVVAEAV
jgi:hypothetical protein